MKNSIFIIVVLLLSLSAVAQSNSAPAPPQVTVIRAGSLIDPRVQEPKRNQVIVIRGDKIESVGDASSTQFPPARRSSICRTPRCCLG